MDLRDEAKTIITATLEKRLLPQWRKGKLKETLEKDMLVSCKEVWMNGRSSGYDVGFKESEKNYKDFIPKPSGSFKSRVKYLFTGKV